MIHAIAETIACGMNTLGGLVSVMILTNVRPVRTSAVRRTLRSQALPRTSSRVRCNAIMSASGGMLIAGCRPGTSNRSVRANSGSAARNSSTSARVSALASPALLLFQRLGRIDVCRPERGDGAGHERRGNQGDTRTRKDDRVLRRNAVQEL